MYPIRNAAAAAATILLLSSCNASSVPTPAPTLVPRAIRVENSITPPDVPMVNQDGVPAKLSDFRGKVVLLFFGNIDCGDSCVEGLPYFQQVKRELGGRSRDVAFVMVGMDNKHDSPEALKRYLAQFDPGFIGLTAEPGPMRELVVRFGIHSYFRDGVLSPHAPFMYLLDRYGRLRVFLQDGLTASVIADEAKQMLDE